MHLTGMTRALYLAVCKDDDNLHAERVRADREEAERLIAKACRIIFADRPPTKISDDPSWWICRLCHHHPLCHEGGFAETNCRTCLHVTAMPEGWWECRLYGGLEDGQQKTGCARHLFNPDLVPGEQIDADPDAGTVTYRLPDGNIWRNGQDGGASC